MQIRRRPPNPAVSVQHLRYQIQVPNAEPQHILEKIVWHKEIEVTRMREKLPLADLQRRVLMAPPARNFLAALRESPRQPALIAEIKKASPSKGVIREDFDPVAIAQAYERGGANCLSVLTDEKFFQGSFKYLAAVRESVNLPLLCKDFLIYPYQMYLARVPGADAVLLIASVLSANDLSYFVRITNALGMTPLIEVHNVEELDRVLKIDGVTLVGINNRNLKDFSVDLNTTRQLLEKRRTQLEAQDILVVSESGLYTAEDLKFVSGVGGQAVLIGESLVKQSDPAQAIAELFTQV